MTKNNLSRSRGNYTHRSFAKLPSRKESLLSDILESLHSPTQKPLTTQRQHATKNSLDFKKNPEMFKTYYKTKSDLKDSNLLNTQSEISQDD